MDCYDVVDLADRSVDGDGVVLVEHGNRLFVDELVGGQDGRVDAIERVACGARLIR